MSPCSTPCSVFLLSFPASFSLPFLASCSLSATTPSDFLPDHWRLLLRSPVTCVAKSRGCASFLSLPDPLLCLTWLSGLPGSAVCTGPLIPLLSHGSPCPHSVLLSCVLFLYMNLKDCSPTQPSSGLPSSPPALGGDLTPPCSPTC